MLVPQREQIDAIALTVDENGKIVPQPNIKPGCGISIFQVDGDDGLIPVVFTWKDTPPTLEFVRENIGQNITSADADTLRKMPDHLVAGTYATSVIKDPETWLNFTTSSLETLADFFKRGQWYMGWLLEGLKRAWDMPDSYVRQYFDGESFDSVAHRLSGRSEQTYWGWMNAASVFLFNERNVEWLEQLDIADVLNIPISKAIRVCGSIEELSAEAVTALFGPSTLDDLRHALSRRDQGTSMDDIPLDKLSDLIAQAEAGYDMPEEAVAKILGTDVDMLPHTNDIEVMDRPNWQYMEDKQVVGYWMDGQWIPAFQVLNPKDAFVSDKLRQIMLMAGIRASRYADSDTRQGQDQVIYSTDYKDSNDVLTWYYDVVMKEESPSVRRSLIENSDWEVNEIIHAIRGMLRSQIADQFGTMCPLEPNKMATDLHEVVVPRNKMRPIEMLSHGAYCLNNCILVSHDVNMDGENPVIRAKLIDIMKQRGFDPLGWFDSLDVSFGRPKIADL